MSKPKGQSAAAQRRPAQDIIPAFFETLMATAPLGISFFDRDLRYVKINATLAAMNGLPVEAHLGRTIGEVLPGIAPTIEPLLRQVLARGEPIVEQDISGERSHAPGQTRHARASYYPLPAAGREIGGVVAIVEDVTERKRAEAENARLYRETEYHAARGQALAAASQTFAEASLDLQTVLDRVTQLVAELIGDFCAIRLISDDGQWLMTVAQYHPNPAARPLMEAVQAVQYRVDEGFMGQVIQTGKAIRIPVLERDEARRGLNPALWPYLDQIGLYSLLMAPLSARGQVIGAVGLTRSTPGQPYTADDLVFLQDLADRAALAIDHARLYAAERDARAAAEAAVRVRDIFLSVASHELKTPLTSLLGNAQLLARRAAREGHLNERDRHSVGVIVDQAIRLNRMVAMLLDISRIERGQLQIERAPLELGALVRRVVDEVAPSLQQHTLAYEAPATPLTVAGDELRLEQVMQNLIGNAVKYSPDGGPVRVVVEQSERMACVSVSDQGIGIPAAALPGIFGRFYRAPNADHQHISGMGVGLFVVREIVTLHGGTVAVESVEGQGSTFSVCLPLAEG